MNRSNFLHFMEASVLTHTSNACPDCCLQDLIRPAFFSSFFSSVFVFSIPNCNKTSPGVTRYQTCSLKCFACYEITDWNGFILRFAYALFIASWESRTQWLSWNYCMFAEWVRLGDFLIERYLPDPYLTKSVVFFPMSFPGVSGPHHRRVHWVLLGWRSVRRGMGSPQLRFWPDAYCGRYRPSQDTLRHRQVRDLFHFDFF